MDLTPTERDFLDVLLEADKGGSQAPIYGFTFAEFHRDEPDLAASWDDL